MDEDMEKGKDEKESTDTPVKVKQEPKERVDIKVRVDSVFLCCRRRKGPKQL